MDLIRNIHSAELKLRQSAEDFFIRIWGTTPLPSHDLDHHRRVWRNAKEILEMIPLPSVISAISGEELFIACYFHDLGMSVNAGSRHGKISRDLCERFLTENNLDLKYFQEALKAIENHDRKEPASLPQEINVAILLSAADDIDALGFTGIFRYAEIYLKRGALMVELGDQIIENAVMRFENLKKNFGVIKGIIDIQQKRLRTLCDFFLEYNREISEKNFDKGYYSLIETIKRMIQENSTSAEYFTSVLEKSDNPVFRWFLEGFIAESVSFNQF